MVDVVNGGDFLQIDRHNPLPLGPVRLGAVGEQPHLAQLLPADLAPAAGRATEIDDPLDVMEDVEDVIDLQKFVGGSGSVALLLGFAIVDILN